MSEHVMIDLETLGKGSHAAIWTIGAVKFNPMHCAETIEELMDTTERFHQRITMESAFRVGRADHSTIEWWMGTERDTARRAIFAMPQVDLVEALDGLCNCLYSSFPLAHTGIRKPQVTKPSYMSR